MIGKIKSSTNTLIEAKKVGPNKWLICYWNLNLVLMITWNFFISFKEIKITAIVRNVSYLITFLKNVILVRFVYGLILVFSMREISNNPKYFNVINNIHRITVKEVLCVIFIVVKVTSWLSDFTVFTSLPKQNVSRVT